MQEASFKPNILKKSAQILQRRNERLNAENVSDAGGAQLVNPSQRANELY